MPVISASHLVVQTPAGKSPSASFMLSVWQMVLGLHGIGRPRTEGRKQTEGAKRQWLPARPSMPFGVSPVHHVISVIFNIAPAAVQSPMPFGVSPVHYKGVPSSPASR